MPEPVILVVGSLHYDIMVECSTLPRKDETAIGSRWYPKFGGKGGNQAVSCARQGAPSRMVGAVGQDDFGRFLLDELARTGVDCRFVAQVAGVGSGMSVAIMDAAGDYAATIVSGANLRIAPESLTDPAIWDGVAILVLQNEIPEAVNLAAAQEASRRGIPTLLNAAPCRDLSDALKALVDLLVVNAVEAEMMGSDPVCCLRSAADAARKLAAQFEAVVVTAGGLGLAMWTAQDGTFQLPAEQVQVVSSHGAGDAFIGALACSLAAGNGLRQSCQTAAHAAALHVASPHQP